MASSAALELQKAILAALTGDATLMGKITGVFDSVPQDQDYPYVVIGDVTINDASTKTDLGEEHTVMIHCWSRYPGRKEVLGLMDDVKRILNQASLAVTGSSLAYLLIDFTATLRDPDGITQHGAQRFKALTTGA